MYIKTLTIQGFKSYHDQTQMEAFSPKHNVVVGRNGSGKSNFFAAIRFVLSDAYTSMSREERQALLHEGVSMAATLSAFVEIIFDNSDNRFLTGKDEVIIRRTIGLKKDEYSLDKKSVSKADIMNLLESAGFSRANPYYIVPQGRITSLTNAKDHERLALLKEVAGTKVYEQRRAESLKIMSDTESKRSKITELLEYIESRLTELEEEMQELKEWTEKDRERRCLEYALYNRELEEVTSTLTELEEERGREVESAKERRNAYGEREKELQKLETELKETKHALATTKLARQGGQSELTELMKSRTELQCVVDDLQAAAARSDGTLDDLRRDLATLEDQIAVQESELETLIPDWDALRLREAEEKRALDDKRGRLSALFAKQGRLSRFKTRAERDRFLNAEIASLRQFQGQQEAASNAIRRELEAVRRSLQEIETRKEQIRREADASRERARTLGEEVAKLKDDHAEMIERRKSLWREDTKLDSLVGRAKEELSTAERTLAGMMDKDTGSGLRSIDRIAERPGFEGVYGPLYRLFQIESDVYNLAVELTAGNSLFHIVVDTDQTASRVLDVMMKERTGRVTFMPLNRLKPKNPPLPQTDEAFPLIDKLRYDSVHEKALQQVFGKTCICENLTLGAKYVKTHNINTITLDGDKVDRKGALSGGYHDIKRSRIDAIKQVEQWRGRYEEEAKKSAEVKLGIRTLEQEITRVAGQVQVKSGLLAKERQTRETLVEEMQALGRETERLKERAAKLESDSGDTETELRALQARLEGYEEEKKSPLAKDLTAEEEEELEALGKQVENLREQLLELGKRKLELGGRKNAIEIELNESLHRRREELQNKIDSIGENRAGDASSAENLEVRARELRMLAKAIEDATKRNRDLDKELDKLTGKLQELRTGLERVQSDQTEDSRSISKQQKATERYLAKKAMLQTRKDECNRSIRDLGVLPEEAFEKYTGDKLDRLVKKLNTVTESLKKFAHVNKKAFEQYANFTKQRDELLKRREDLDASAQSIEELVDRLDMRKDEAIERTFKQVASNFEEVFEQLVPAGRGRLIIQRKIDQDEAEEDEETQQTSVDNYTGVAIKVSFNSKVDEGLRIQQLSGGQKSLVALALVFSIQKCDPAPFYLFDEIDANLDAQYRTAVANMIHSLSENAQFITTTFRPEMLVNANKFYGVLFGDDKISRIRSIRREEAMGFVEQEAQAQ